MTLVIRNWLCYDCPQSVPAKNSGFIFDYEYRISMCTVLRSELSCNITCDLTMCIIALVGSMHKRSEWFPILIHLYTHIAKRIVLRIPFELHNDLSILRISRSCTARVLGVGNDIWFYLEWQVVIEITVLVISRYHKLQVLCDLLACLDLYYIMVCLRFTQH